jgi:hypothetical protein
LRGTTTELGGTYNKGNTYNTTIANDCFLKTKCRSRELLVRAHASCKREFDVRAYARIQNTEDACTRLCAVQTGQTRRRRSSGTYSVNSVMGTHCTLGIYKGHTIRRKCTGNGLRKMMPPIQGMRELRKSTKRPLKH